MKPGDILVCVTDYYDKFHNGEYYAIYGMMYSGGNEVDMSKIFLLEDGKHITTVYLNGPFKIDGVTDFKGFYSGENVQEHFITLSEFKYRNRSKKLEMLDESL